MAENNESIYKKLFKNMAKNIYSSFQHPPYRLEKKLLMYLKLMDEKNSIATLNEINALERATLSEYPLISIKNSLICSCTLFTRTIIEAGVDSETAFMLSDFYISKFDKSFTVPQAEMLEYDMLKEYIKILRTTKEYIYNPTINRVISYIRKNIEQKISLKELAEHVNVHPNYLSTAFKKEVGINISDYITKQRIEAIKLFLTETNLSLIEISNTFNFSSQAHFCNYFKEDTGLSPLKFRRMFCLSN
ncbi:MAG: AraC family transcriptional regulator [Clostridiaceae bacterium]|nr:AraC family transcriptional regulator [Clostridiaceae bacterium]